MPRNLCNFFSLKAPQSATFQGSHRTQPPFNLLNSTYMLMSIYAKLMKRWLTNYAAYICPKMVRQVPIFTPKFHDRSATEHKMQLIYFERQTSLKCAHMSNVQWAERHVCDRTVLSNNRRFVKRPVHTVICMRSHIHTEGQPLFFKSGISYEHSENLLN